MVQGMYVIYDKVAEECGPIQMAKNNGIANRMFISALADNPHILDYALYCLGRLNTETMSVLLFSEPELVRTDSEVEDDE